MSKRIQFQFSSDDEIPMGKRLAIRPKDVPVKDASASSGSGTTDSVSKCRPPIDNVFVIARKSSKTTDLKTITELSKRNLKLYNTFQMNIHPRLHDEDYTCQATFHNVILNGWSSNNDLSATRLESMMELRSRILRSESESNTSSNILISASEEGLTTNCVGFVEFFNQFERPGDILYLIFLGGRRWKRYTVQELLQAVAERREGLKIANKAHALVMDWTTISLNKEEVADKLRDVRRIIPGKRNITEIDTGHWEWDEDDEDVQEPDIIQYTSAAIALRRTEGTRIGLKDAQKGVQPKYELESTESGVLCPVRGCEAVLNDHENLVDHLWEHCNAVRKCILCTEESPHAELHESGFKRTIGTTQHLERHLPPAEECGQCHRSFAGYIALMNHERTHNEPNKRKKVPCQHCDKLFHSKRDMENHVRSKHLKLPPVPTVSCRLGCGKMLNSVPARAHHELYMCDLRPGVLKIHECPEIGCDERFANIQALSTHRKTAHIRRNQILENAASMGVEIQENRISDLVASSAGFESCRNADLGGLTRTLRNDHC